jgi:subtilase family serine protease
VRLTRAASAALISAVPLVALAVALPADADSQPHVTPLSASAAPNIASASKLGPADANKQVQVAVSLNLRDRAGLDAFIAQVNDPHSALYQHYLTPQQFAERYAPTQAQVDSVRKYLADQGLSVTGVASNRMAVDAKGTTAQLESAFHTSMSRYHDAKLKRDFTANDSAPSVSSSIAPLISGVSGLNDHYVRHHQDVQPAATPKVGSGPAGGYTPAELKGAYGINTIGLDGSGQKVAVFEFANYVQTNIAQYSSHYGLGSPTPVKVNVDGGNTTLGDAEVEVELDIEVVNAIAPKANVDVYIAPNSDAGEIDMWNQLVSNNVPITSSSWGLCELDRTAANLSAVDNAAAQAAAQGMTFLSAAGDSGAYDCERDGGSNTTKLAVDFPGSDPNVTSVGGTDLALSGGGYGSESVWNESGGWSGGGGVSNTYARPSWQTGPGVDTAAKRQVPDVSAVAAGGEYSIYTQGSWTTVGGTSASTPLWAGYLALVNQKAASQSKPRVGAVNAKLYQIGASSGYGNAFHDVTTGNNRYYNAAANFDKASGWGSPKAPGLTDALLGGGSTGSISVTNPGSKTGTVGTAISTLQLSASGGTAPYTWTASGLPAGLSISSSGAITGTPSTAGTYNVTVTATDSSSAHATGNASFTWTISGAGGTCSGQKFANPGFETTGGWTTSSGVISTASGSAVPHSGTHFAWLDGYGSTHTDTAAQTVSIPAGCHATLTYYLYITTSETGTIAYDKFTVKAGSTTVQSYSNVNHSTGYVQHSVDLSAYAGQSVTITFTGTEDSSLATSFLVDDTALTLS